MKRRLRSYAPLEERTVMARKNKYTDEELLTMLKKKASELGRSPSQNEVCADKNMPSSSAISRRFGSYSAALKKIGLEPVPFRQPQRYSDEDLLKMLQAFAKKLGRPPLKAEVDTAATKGLMPTGITYGTRFGSWEKALLAAGLEEIEQQTRSKPRKRGRGVRRRLMRLGE